MRLKNDRQIICTYFHAARCHDLCQLITFLAVLRVINIEIVVSRVVNHGFRDQMSLSGENPVKLRILRAKKYEG